MSRVQLVMAKDMAAEYAIIQAVELELSQLPCVGPIEVMLLNLSCLTFGHGDRKIEVNATPDGDYHLNFIKPGVDLLCVVFPNTEVAMAAKCICAFVLHDVFPESASSLGVSNVPLSVQLHL